MRKDTGEIKEYDKIPEPEKRDDSWSEPFHLGEVVEFKGVRMKIIKIKKLRKQIHLQSQESK